MMKCIFLPMRLLSIDDSDPILESVMESNFQAFVVVLTAATFSPSK